MLPIRFACSGLVSRLLSMALLFILGGAFLGSAGAGPLPPQGVEDFRALIDSKQREPKPESATPDVLAEYRRKLRQAAKELPSLGEVARVLLLSEWSYADLDPEPSVQLDQVKKAVRQTQDEAFKREIQQLTAKADDPGAVNQAILAEIKREVRLQLLDRLEKRTRFYMLEGRAEDRIAAANLIRDTMTNSRRQDISMYHDEKTGAVVPGVMRNTPDAVKPSSHNLRQRLRELDKDLKKLTEHPNVQVRVAGILALSDLENDARFLVDVYKPLLTSPQSDVMTRKATADALGHVLEVFASQLEKDRPEPYLRGLQLVLPVAVLGLSDEDAGVRRSSLEACARGAQIFGDLTGSLQAVDRQIVFRPAMIVMEEILPKLNSATRDRLPEIRVGACRVLEELVLAMQKLQRYKAAPLPMPPQIEPSKPDLLPRPENGKYRKRVALPPHPSGRRRVSAGSSQWATVRPQMRSALPIPPVPVSGETAAPVVTLERPIELSASQGSPNSAAPLMRTAAFLAPQLDELPPPAPVATGIQATVQMLIENLKDPDYRVRLAAADALETLGDRAVAAIPALVAALCDSNKFVRWSSARSLGQLNPRQADEVVPGLMRLLDDREDPSVRIAAAKALEQYSEHAKKAVPLLARVINRGDKEYIIAILRTIQGIGTDAAPALPNVAWLLSDRSQPPSVRKEAAQTLGRFGALAKEQLPALRDVMVNDPDEDVRNAASTAVLAVDRPERQK